MEINARIPDDYCQGDAPRLEPVELEEIEFPVEDRIKRVKSVKVTRGKRK